MKRFLIAILFALLLTSPVHAWQGAVGMGQSVPAASSPTPRASFALDALGGTDTKQVYDSIAEAWVGGDCDTADFSGGYLVADSTSDRCYIPGSYFQITGGQVGITVVVDYQVSNVGDANLYPFYYVTSSNDLLAFHHQQSGTTGETIWKSNGDATYPYARWTKTGYNTVNTWYTIKIKVDVTNHNLDVYLKTEAGSYTVPADYAVTNEDSLVDWGTLADKIYLGYIVTGTNIVRVKNLKIYDGFVDP